MATFITRESLQGKMMERRIQRVSNSKRLPAVLKESMLDQLNNGQIPFAQFREGVDLEKKIRSIDRAGKVAEFIGTGNFPAEWWERARYEVQTGRDLEPLIYQSIYSIVSDPNLPRLVKIYKFTGAGVVFEEVTEGGEVKWASLASTSQTAEIKHYAVGLKYDEDVFIYNELFRLARIERNFGTAHNALLNHIHMSPILTASYAAANATDGTTLLSFKVAASYTEKYSRTLSAAINAAQLDTTNPRRGPYTLVINAADADPVARVLNRVPQEGFEQQDVAVPSRINNVVVYDGWTGTRGKKQVSYAGVGAGEAYLVHTGNRDEDFSSYEKHGLRQQTGEGDLSRFIEAEEVWDSRFGIYANPTAAVEKITWPVAASGAA